MASGTSHTLWCFRHRWWQMPSAHCLTCWNPLVRVAVGGRKWAWENLSRGGGLACKGVAKWGSGCFFYCLHSTTLIFFSLDLHLKTNLIYTWLKISCIFILLSTWQQNATVFKVAKTWSFGNGPLRSDFAFCHLTRQIFGEGMLVVSIDEYSHCFLWIWAPS